MWAEDSVSVSDQVRMEWNCLLRACCAGRLTRHRCMRKGHGPCSTVGLLRRHSNPERYGASWPSAVVCRQIRRWLVQKNLNTAFDPDSDESLVRTMLRVPLPLRSSFAGSLARWSRASPSGSGPTCDASKRRKSTGLLSGQAVYRRIDHDLRALRGLVRHCVR